MAFRRIWCATVLVAGSACVETTTPGTNDSPAATIDNPSQDTSVVVGASVTFEGTASDPDGTVVSHAWAFGDGGAAGGEDPGAHVYDAVGIYAVTYTVTDDDGATDEATRTVTVTQPANLPPTVAITSPNGNVAVVLGSPVTFQGTANDVDGTVVSHAWTFGDGETAGVEDPGDHTYGAVGSFTVIYTVSDDDGATATATRTVTVLEPTSNQPPTAMITAPATDVSIMLGASVSFQGTASDADGSVVSHAWTFGDGNTATVEDPGSRTYAAVGIYAVTYTVMDDDGATATATRTVTVLQPTGNQPPTAGITSPNGDVSVLLGTSVTFLGTANDTDGTVVAHAWAFGDGGTSSAEDPGSRTYAAVGVYTVTYTVRDDDGATATATRTVTVLQPGNDPPLAAITSPATNVTITLGGSVNFQGAASDPDGTVVSHVWTFGDGGTANVEDPGNRSYAAVGTYAVTYRVTDDDGAFAEATRTVTVVQPTVGNFALRFFGNGVNDIDRVKIRVDDPTNSLAGPPVDVGATDFTIELWMRATAGENTSGAVTCGANINWILGNMILDRDRYNQDRDFGLSMAGGRLVFGVSADGAQHRTICGSRRVDDGQWHHVAVTRARSTGMLRLFVDGSLDASAQGPNGDISYPDNGVPGSYCGGPCTNSDPFIVIGAEKHDVSATQYPAFSGWIDELRFSMVLRYTGPFTPPSARFQPDGSTVGLYHFDEGSGNTVGDSSGAAGGPSAGVRRLGGSPAGPQWVASDAPTGNP